MSHNEVINNCKKITIRHLVKAIGEFNIVSIILFGSVARNEASFKYVNGKLFLESDLDVLLVVRNRFTALKWLVRLRHLSERLSSELRKECLVSYANLSVTAQDRLLDAYPNAFYLHVKLNGKVIFGKELIEMMPNYEYRKIPADDLCRMIFGHMIFVVRSIASSGIFDGSVTVDSYNSVLKSIRKLTLFLLRAIIIKDSLPVNPYDMTDIRDKGNLYKTTNLLCDDLLSSYDDIKLCNSKEDCSMVNLEKYVARIVTQFNSTLAKLTGINYPFITLPKKLIFGYFPLIRRIEYSIYVFLINLNTRWTLELFKFLIFIVRGPESIYLRYYHLLLSSTNLIKSTNDVGMDAIQQRLSWLKLYQKSLKPWKYDKATG
jgi:predicted nucleotidyltransferase